MKLKHIGHRVEKRGKLSEVGRGVAFAKLRGATRLLSAIRRFAGGRGRAADDAAGGRIDRKLWGESRKIAEVRDVEDSARAALSAMDDPVIESKRQWGKLWDILNGLQEHRRNVHRFAMDAPGAASAMSDGHRAMTQGKQLLFKYRHLESGSRTLTNWPRPLN